MLYGRVDDTSTITNMIERFNEEHPNINVVQESTPSGDARDSYVTRFAGRDDSFDIAQIDIVWTPEFASAGWIAPLNEYFTDSELDAFLPGPITGTSYDGQQYAIPRFTDAGILYYRKDLLEEEGLEPPTTFDELYTQAGLLQSNYDVSQGMTLQAQQYEGLICNILEYMWGNGGNVLDEDNNVVLHSEENIEALDFFAKLVKSNVTPSGVSSYVEEDARVPFNQADSAFQRNWFYVWGHVQAEDSPVKGKVGMAPMPVGPNGEESAATLGGWNMAINNFSNHKEEAATFIKYITNEEAQIENALNTGRLPTLKSVYNSEKVLEEYPHFEELYDVFINAKPRPVSPMYSQISEVMQREIHSVITGSKNSNEALRDAHNEIENMIN
ncbi:ABC transporter substrate-binding protein [Halanaerobium sp. Z-7514]|uniref:ABC transporter substrate-binding protein n=1 Tax=Halanaerobium polyolivorans TaxID=2886943 RepID=A0AAW4X1B3_9FIRM|nr:ABC transporter substrate-binding protein [Halanaerobium polyolivorans]